MSDARPTHRFVLAVVVVIAAFLLRQTLVLRFHLELPPFITFYPAVMVVSLLCGFLPGLLATALSSIFAAFWVLPPLRQFKIANTSDAVAVALFLVMGVIIALAAKRYSGYQRRIAALERAQALHASEERYSLLFEGNMDSIFLTKPGGEVLAANPAACAMFGMTEEEFIGVGRKWTADANDPRLAIALEERERAGKFKGELTYIRKDGSKFICEINSFVIPGDELHFAILRDITARKLAEEASRESRAKLEAALEGMTDAVFISDDRGHFIDFNDAFATFHRFKSKAECGKSSAEYRDLIDLFMANGDPVLAENWVVPRALRGETGTNAEYTIRRKDTGETWIGSYTFSPIRDKDGAIAGAVVTARDITERRRADEALRDSQAKLKGIINSAMDAVISVDEQQRIVGFNRAAETIFHCAASEALGSSLDRFISEPRRAAHREHVRRFGSKGVTARSMTSPALLTAIRSNGEVFPIEATISHLKTGEDRLYTVILRDITERKRAEEALRASERLYRGIGESISYGVWVCDPDGRNVYASDSFLNLVGMTQQQCSDSGWAGTLHPDDAESTLAAWKECVRTEGMWDIEQRVRGVDGQWHPILARGVPVRDDKGQIISWAGINLDISNIKRAEQALLRSEKLASVGRMAAAIAHEINDPLEAVTNLIYLAKMDKEMPATARQFLDMADGELKQVAHITRQALGFYRESNAPAVVPVNAVLDSAVALMKNKIRAKQAVISKEWDGDLRVIGLEGELRQVYSNLLGNSLDAIDDGGTIKLKVSTGTHTRDGYPCVRVTVADNGRGIKASSRQHIFEPFFTTKGTVGTGLGLWVTKQIVDKHCGTIRMRSSTDGARRGTVFSIVLPVDPPAVKSDPPAASEDATLAAAD
jgi:PAS domain S-box-containing protein